MIMLRKIPLFVLIMTLPLLWGCEFKDVQLESIEEISLESLQGGQIDGTIHMVLSNPNAFSITVKSADFKLYNGNVKLGEASLRKAFKIDANSSKSYPVQLSGNLSNALAGGFMGLAGALTGKKPKVTIKGELKAGNFFFTKKVPIEEETELPLGL
jgi:LEA14-like dessication related protein